MEIKEIILKYGEEMVIVEDLKDGKLFTAPLNNFKRTVGKKKK